MYFIESIYNTTIKYDVERAKYMYVSHCVGTNSKAVVSCAIIACNTLQKLQALQHVGKQLLQRVACNNCMQQLHMKPHLT